MYETQIKGVVKCASCHRYFQGEKEVTITVEEAQPKGQDIKNMISDWYRCPLCHQTLYGLMQWASHTWQEHKLPVDVFEEKYGVEKSFYNTKFGPHYNPSKRNEE